MKKTSTLLSAAALSIAILFASCKKAAVVKPKEEVPAAVVKVFKNLPAPQQGIPGQSASGPFTKFSFEKGAVVTGDNWDLAFRGTTILVNGGTNIGITDEPNREGNAGVVIASSTFEAIKDATRSGSFVQDANGAYAIPTGSGNGWYSYNPSNHIVTPLAGKILVVKTHNGKYAKVEILSYYKDAPATPSPMQGSRHYTFRYAYQTQGTLF